MKTSISLCMIVRDEARNIALCLESVKDVADEMIIVDTGSQDNTVSIAQSFGARVLFHEWQEDFSISRNLSLENATGDWILILDADEVLEEKCKTNIRKLILKKDFLGYLVLIQMHPAWTETRSLRLFRNSPLLRYRGVFHEKFAVPDRIIHKFVPADIRIIHKPWSKEALKKKNPRNIRMLKKHINLYPDDIYQILDLAKLYLENEKISEAEKLLERVLLLLSRTRKGDRNYNIYHAHYYLYKLKLLSMENSDFQGMLSLCEEALSALPNCPLFLYEAAKINYKLMSYDKSIDYFQKCLGLRDDDGFELIMMFPKDILGAMSLNGLGFNFFKKREYHESIRYFEESYKLKKDKKVKAMINASRSLIQKHKKIKKKATSIVL